MGRIINLISGKKILMTNKNENQDKPQTREESDKIINDPKEQEKAQKNNDKLIKQLQEELKKRKDGK